MFWSRMNVRFAADTVEEVLLARRAKFFEAANAFPSRGYEGPRRLAQKPPLAFVLALKHVATLKTTKNELSRDFDVVRFSTFSTVSARSDRSIIAHSAKSSLGLRSTRVRGMPNVFIPLPYWLGAGTAARSVQPACVGRF
jgi:hypothetical protein